MLTISPNICTSQMWCFWHTTANLVCYCLPGAITKKEEKCSSAGDLTSRHEQLLTLSMNYKENYTQYASQVKPVTTTPNRCASAMERRQRYFQLRDYLTMYSKSCVCLFIFFGFVLSACLLALTSDCCEPYAKKFMAAHYTISWCLAGLVMIA